MKGDKEIYKKARGFDKNPQNINRTGANRKMVSSVIKDLRDVGVEETTSAEIKAVYLMLVNLTIAEIEEIVKDDNQPALVRIVGKEVLSGKGFDIIEKMLDRAIGKSQQSIDHTSKGDKVQPTTIIFTDDPSDAD